MLKINLSSILKNAIWIVGQGKIVLSQDRFWDKQLSKAVNIRIFSNKIWSAKFTRVFRNNYNISVRIIIWNNYQYNSYLNISHHHTFCNSVKS